ncbi:MAG: hypothetical protein WB870_07520 [Gallionellaceae bacterium]
MPKKHGRWKGMLADFNKLLAAFAAPVVRRRHSGSKGQHIKFSNTRLYKFRRRNAKARSQCFDLHV